MQLLRTTFILGNYCTGSCRVVSTCTGRKSESWNCVKSILASWIELHGEESENLQRRPDKVQLYKPAHVVSTQQQDFVETINCCTTPAWIWARIWRPYCWAKGELLTERSLSLICCQCCWIVVSSLACYLQKRKLTKHPSVSLYCKIDQIHAGYAISLGYHYSGFKSLTLVIGDLTLCACSGKSLAPGPFCSFLSRDITSQHAGRELPQVKMFP